MDFDATRCRSLLFVPAGNDRFLDSALRGAADVIQIDLEDAVPPDRKAEARTAAAAAVERIAGAGRVAAVRVNRPLRLLVRDLEAVVRPGLAALTVPKVGSAERLRLIDETVAELEAERGMAAGGVRLLAQIETAGGLERLGEIARATPRLAAMTVGPEDLVAELGGEVVPDTLYHANMSLLTAARAAGVIPLGYVGSITVYDDEDTYREWIRQARRLGFEGAFCIHPKQVAILNAVLSPTAEEVEAARRLIAAAEAQAARGVGAFAHEGRMVDAPIVDRARLVLRRHAALAG